MYYKVLSSALSGVEGRQVGVEVDISPGFPRFDIVGLPDSSVKEAVDRVRTAIRNSGFDMPVERITVNLSPAYIRKEGAGFDLAIAIGIMACKEVVPRNNCEGMLFLGELSLSGEVKPIRGILPMVHSAKQTGIEVCVVPSENAFEASLISGIKVIGVKDLKEVVGFLLGTYYIEETRTDFDGLHRPDEHKIMDYSDVRGQEHVKRALEIAAAGRHNVMMIGPPGSGKTMMAKRIDTIMPSLTYDESVEVTKVYSVSGRTLTGDGLIFKRPFRAPHHTISDASLVGGGKVPKPGEISLAHNGILFLDELPEFRKHVIEVMRQPIEDGTITINRVNGKAEYPARFMLVASMNPCPCGYYPDSEKCQCTPWQIQRYLGKLSGPLLDRVDIHIEAGSVDFETYEKEQVGEPSRNIKARVVQAIDRQKKRHNLLGYDYNADIRPGDIDRLCRLNEEGQMLLRKAFKKMGLSTRAYHRVLKVARTIADLAGSVDILPEHVAEAIQYRTLDRKYWHR